MTLSKPSNNVACYPIGAVAEITGIKVMTLRAWERRYAAIQPSRSHNGRRMYSLEDIHKLKAIKKLLDEGFAIGQAAEAIKNNEEILKIEEQELNVWHHYLKSVKLAISLFDEHQLDDLYNDIISQHPFDVVTKNFILPLMYDLGENWETREGSVVEEHFFSAYLRNKLGARFHHQNRLNDGKPIVIAGLPGDYHEFGLLLVALALMNRGLRVLILGPNLPLSELLHALNTFDARAIALAGSHEINIQQIIDKLKTIKEIVNIPVFIGGDVANKYQQTLLSAGMHPVGADLSIGIDNIINHIESNLQQGQSA